MEVSLEKNTKITNLWVVPLGGGGSTEAKTKAGPSTTTDAKNAPASAQDDTSLKERQLTFGEVSQTYGRFSPDGKWVSLISAGGGSSQIWTAAWDEETGTMQKPHPLTNVSTEADGAEWSPDSQRLLFVSSVYPECSVKDASAYEKVQLQTQNAGVSPLRSAPVEMTASRAGLRSATWAEEDACNKAKDEAAAKSKVKAQVWDSLLYRHWDQYTGKKRSHVLVVSRANGEDVRDLTPASAVGDAEVPTFSLGGPLGYAWAPDSKEIAYVANLDKVPAASTNNDVFTLRLDEPGAKAVKVSTSPGSDDGPQYSPDGKYLAFRSQARGGYESDRFRLMLFDREKKTARELMPKFDRWVDEFVWAPDSKTTYFASGEHGQEQIFNVSLDSSLATQYTATDYSHRIGGNFSAEFAELHISSDGKILVATGVKVDSPSNIYRFGIDYFPPESVSKESALVTWMNSEGGDHAASRMVSVSSDPITHLNDAALSVLDISKIESYWFAGADDAKVQGFLVKPPNFDSAKKYPVKFLIHGGPQGAWGDAWSYRWNPELMAASGYVVVMVNPRGSTGYGQAFIDGVNGDWGGKAYVDLMKGLDAAEAKFPFIDKDRECALGASYGGYMADWVLTHTNRFKCIVTHDGMFDPVSAYGATEEMWFNEWEFRRGPATGAAAWDKEPASPWRYQGLPAEQDPFRKWSPLLHIKDAKTPTLVVHSQRDYRLDVSQGFQLFTALQRLGVPSKFLYFPDEGHWVLKPQNSQLWYETVGDWCDRWTKTGKYAVVTP
jgi:dipeptidyl aminopeptidase/acylaminoacyl peptidase